MRERVKYEGLILVPVERVKYEGANFGTSGKGEV